jgi:hypothetical protein
MAMRERDFGQACRHHRQGQNNNLYELHNSPPLTERNKNQPFTSGQPWRRLHWHTGNDRRLPKHRPFRLAARCRRFVKIVKLRSF